MQAERLFRDFCYYRQHTAYVQGIKRDKPYIREPKETPERLKLFSSMAQWCEDQGFSASEWLYSLFVSRKWWFPPKLDSRHLQSKKHIPKYKKLQDYGLYRQRQMEVESMGAPSKSTFDPNRDLSHTAEDAKQAYLATGQEQVCMAGMLSETFGYHPKSSVCARCSAAQVCLDQLRRNVSFDVLGLRMGDITSDQAKSQALMQVQHYGR